jgi:dihydrofolate reductase
VLLRHRPRNPPEAVTLGSSVGEEEMRDLIVTENITLDGVTEATEDWFAPAGADSDVDQSDVEAALREQRKAADVFLVGRVTFESMRGYWPQQTDDTTGITDYLNNVSKYVVSSTLDDPRWEHTTVLRGALEDEVVALKSEPGKDIVTTGSITLVHGLISAGLVDEYRLFVYPVVIGRGRRLFADASGIPRLRLVNTQPFRSGIVLLRYRIA